MKIAANTLKTLAALAIALSPTIALAQHHTPTAHVRQNLFHDRAPQPEHDRGTVAHHQ